MPDITFRTSCKDCKFYGRCLFDANIRMIKKRCYVDTIAKKLKIQPKTVVDRCNSFIQKYGLGDFSGIRTIDETYWQKMSNSERKIDIKLNLKRWIECKNAIVTNEDVNLFNAVANCYFSAWRDEAYIHCAKCGELIKNSKQRNRKYCDNCKTNNKSVILKTCIDCGVKFYPESNREVRCIDCQIKANKASARERARRYRERKRNGLENKS